MRNFEMYLEKSRRKAVRYIKDLKINICIRTNSEFVSYAYVKKKVVKKYCYFLEKAP